MAVFHTHRNSEADRILRPKERVYWQMLGFTREKIRKGLIWRQIEGALSSQFRFGKLIRLGSGVCVHPMHDRSVHDRRHGAAFQRSPD